MSSTSNEDLPLSPSHRIKVHRRLRRSNQDIDEETSTTDTNSASGSIPHSGSLDIEDNETEIMKHVESRFESYRRQAQEMLLASKKERMESQKFMEKLREQSILKRESCFTGMGDLKK